MLAHEMNTDWKPGKNDEKIKTKQNSNKKNKPKNGKEQKRHETHNGCDSQPIKYQ